MNQKLQRVVRDIERAKSKIEELQALLPELERQRTELENVEIVKVFRSADVTPDDFAEFVAAYKAQGGASANTAAAPQASGYPGTAPQQHRMEESDDE